MNGTWGDLTTRVRDLVAENDRLKAKVRDREAEILRLRTEENHAGVELEKVKYDLDKAQQALAILGVLPDLPVTTESPTPGTMKAKAYEIQKETDAQQRALDDIRARYPDYTVANRIARGE